MRAVTNSIFWENGNSQIYFRDSGDEVSLNISYSLVENGQNGIDTNNNGDSNYNERMESYFKNNNRIFAVACALIITAISTLIHILISETNNNLMHSGGEKGVNNAVPNRDGCTAMDRLRKQRRRPR